MADRTSHSYYVVMIQYPPRYLSGVRVSPAACEAVVDPEVTRRGVIQRIRSREYDPESIAFIHHVDGVNEYPLDVTTELIAEAEQMEDA